MSKRRTPEPPPTRGGPPPLRKPDEPGSGNKRRITFRQRMKNLMRRKSIGGMRENLSHVLVYGLYFFVGIFFVGAIWSFGSPKENADQKQEAQTIVDPVASVGRTSLALADWQAMLKRMRLDDNQAFSYRYQQTGSMAEAWIRQHVELGLAKRRGVSVSSAELDKEITKRINESLKNERGQLTEKQWRYQLQKSGSSLEQKQSEMRKKLAASDSGLRDELLVEKLRKSIEGEVKLTDKDYAEANEEVAGRVILVRSGTVKPSPLGEDQKETDEQKKQRTEQEGKWKTDLEAKKADAEKLLAQVKATPDKFAEIAKAKSDDFSKDQGGELKSTNRTSSRFGDDFKKVAFETKVGEISPLIQGDEGWVIFKCEARKTWPDDFKKVDPRNFADAQKIADDLYAQLIKTPADFEKLAKEKSDDPGSKVKGGDLGEVGHGQMVKPFEKMIFALDKDEISKPFRSGFGIHIAQVTERVLPKAGETVPDDKDPDVDPADKKAVEEAKALKELPLPNHTNLPKALKVKVRHILIKAEDPAKKIADLQQQLEDRKKSEHYEKVVKDERKAEFDNGTIKLYDPELRAYFAAQLGKPEQESALLQAAVGTPGTRPEIHFELAKKYDQAAMTGAMGPDSTKNQIDAINALGKDPAAAKGLIDALDTFLPDVRLALCNALGEIKAQEAVPKLQEIVKSDPDDKTADAAKAALQKMSAQVPERKTTKPALPSFSPGAPGAPSVPGMPSPVPPIPSAELPPAK